MNFKQIYKGVDCSSVFSSIFPAGDYIVQDVPFSLRKNDMEKINLDKLSFPVSDDEESLVTIDKLYFMLTSLLKVNSDILKHLNLIVFPEIKHCDLVADFLIIRHNRVLLVGFCYDLTCNNNPEMKETKVNYVMNRINSTLKKYLPLDTVVSTYLFNIRKGDNLFEINRLASTIQDLYQKTTNKELIKLIK